jgi:sodium/potassium-transporting ATPase subunit alpha
LQIDLYSCACDSFHILLCSTGVKLLTKARGRNFAYAAAFGIGIIIAWIPQGLPLTVTMILAISGRRMAERKVLVKDLHGLETLGSITMLATDKTGTLTRYLHSNLVTI